MFSSMRQAGGCAGVLQTDLQGEESIFFLQNSKIILSCTLKKERNAIFVIYWEKTRPLASIGTMQSHSVISCVLIDDLSGGRLLWLTNDSLLVLALKLVNCPSIQSWEFNFVNYLGDSLGRRGDLSFVGFDGWSIGQVLQFVDAHQPVLSRIGFFDVLQSYVLNQADNQVIKPIVKVVIVLIDTRIKKTIGKGIQYFKKTFV